MPEPRAPREAPFSCATVVLASGETWIRVGGELDLATAPALAAACAEACRRATGVVLDLRDLTFLDVAGLGAVLRAASAARSRSVRFAVLRGVPAVDAVFLHTNTGAQVEIVDADSFGVPAR